MTTEVQNKEQTQGTYKGAYRKDVYEDDDLQDATLEEQETDEEQQEEETISLKTSKKEDHDYKKRYDDLKKHYDSKLYEWKQERESLTNEQAMLSSFDEEPESQPEPQDNPELEQFKQSYPEVYNVVEQVSTKNASKEVEELRAEVQRLSEREEELQAKSAYQQLLALHPDFPELKKSDDFKTWLGDQPPSIAEGVTGNSSDVKYASRVLDLYKADKGLNKKRGRPKGSAAEAVTKTNAKTVSVNQDASKKTWTTSEIRKLKPHEYEKLEAELDLANAEGRIINQ